MLRGLFRLHNLRIYTILPSHFRMNPPAEIGNSLPSGDDVSALTSSTRTLRSSTSTTTDTPPVVYRSLPPHVPVEDRNSGDGNVILDVCELRKKINEGMFCRKCAEVQIEKKCNSFLDFVMAEEDALQATSHSMPFRSKRQREIWLEQNRTKKNGRMTRYKNHCTMAKLGWLDDCQSQPMRDISITIVGGIAATLVAKCAAGHTISIQPTKIASHNNNEDISEQKKKLKGNTGRHNQSYTAYQLNHQLVAGMQLCGDGGTQAENIVANLQLPHASNLRTIFSSVENHIGAIECDISSSLQAEALQREIELTREKEGAKCQSSDNKTILTVSYDMGWSKRSSGNKYDSKSGHAHILGYYTREFMGTKLFCKSCIVCDNAERYKEVPRKHVCAKNYEGASKSMESDAILALCIDAPNHGYYIGTIISDDDTNMRSHLKQKQTTLKSDKGKLPVSIS